MADIKQATQWLKEGKSVKRAGQWVRYKIVGNGVIAVFGKRKRLNWDGGITNISYLLAEDWEIFKPEDRNAARGEGPRTEQPDGREVQNISSCSHPKQKFSGAWRCAECGERME